MALKDSPITASHDSNRAPSIPVPSMVESIIGCKWSVRLLLLIAEESRRPSELLKACRGLSAKVMNERLRKMMRFGIVRRTVTGEKPPVEVDYALTPFGSRFMGILEEVRRLQEDLDQGNLEMDSTSRAARKNIGQASP